MQPEIDKTEFSAAMDLLSIRMGEPLALRPREAAKTLGVSPRYLWSITKAGKIPCLRLGSGPRKTVLYPVAGLRQFLATQSAPQTD